MDAQRQIGKALKQFPGHSAADAPIVIDSLVERSGILQEKSPGELSFIHDSLKDLLAGDYFAGEGSAGLLANHAMDRAWEPVILFAVGANIRGFATKTIRKILEPTSDISNSALRARQLMALRCRAAALYVDEEIDLRLQQLTSVLFPPRNMEDAEALASGGNTVVPFLVQNSDLESGEAAASIRSLRMIGTTQAWHALQQYLGDRRMIVIAELALTFNPLEIEWVREQLLAGKRIPKELAAQVTNLSPLARLENVQSLDLMGTQVLDLSPLARLQTLQYLDLGGTPVADLSPLSKLENLQSLVLWQTKVTDLSVLERLKNLQSLDLWHTQVTDLSPLAGLENLRSLDLDWTPVADLSSLTDLRNLQRLGLMQTQVADLSPLEGLNNLKSLDLMQTQVADLSPLAGLKNLQSLDLTQTQVTDISPLSSLKNLQSLNLTQTQVADLSPLAGLKKLRWLQGQSGRRGDHHYGKISERAPSLPETKGRPRATE